jgi:hypothetical protein
MSKTYVGALIANNLKKKLKSQQLTLYINFVSSQNLKLDMSVFIMKSLSVASYI